MAEPALWGSRRRLLDLMDKLHLARPAVRGYELALAARSVLAARRPGSTDGLPLPPTRLRAQIGPSHADANVFLGSGQRQAELVRSLVREGGSAVEDFDAILDWGCGCGRILRHWSGLTKTRVYGCDIDERMVGWCADHLDFAEVTVNDIMPPLPYPGATFDLVYAFSVFTHLSEDLQRAWIRECLRILKPKGYLLMSTMGEHYLSLRRLNEAEEQAFRNGNVVVLYEDSAGTSLCSAYHPAEYVHENLGADFELIAFRPATDDGRHDIHLLRKPASERVRAE